MAAPSPSRGPSPEALLRRVELRIARRLDGLLQGERRGRRPGPGGEPSLTRGYEDGDDVRWVDWPLSARVGEPMVRVPEIEPVLTAWALVDCSPSMAYGSEVRTKLELAREVLGGVGVVMRRRGDRLGVVATRGGDLDLVRPPRADRRGLVAALAAVERLPALEPGAAGVRTDLTRAISSLGRIARHRGAVVIISDFPLQPGLEHAIGGLSRTPRDHRHRGARPARARPAPRGAGGAARPGDRPPPAGRHGRPALPRAASPPRWSPPIAPAPRSWPVPGPATPS